MTQHMQTLRDTMMPRLLREIADPPRHLYLEGTLPDPETHAYLCVVGSRKYSPYGKAACERIIAGLAGYPVVIVSGLALGMDAIAHEAALAARLATIAIPGSGLERSVLYPASHRALAERILTAGGALLSEFPPDYRARPESFPQRNRIMAGLSRAVLVIEAALRSGTLITARLATDYNRDVCAIPGSIFSETSAGPHLLIKLGATPITSSADVLAVLGIPPRTEHTQDTRAYSPQEEMLMRELASPKTREELHDKLALAPGELNRMLSALELKGYIGEHMGMIERI